MVAEIPRSPHVYIPVGVISVINTKSGHSSQQKIFEQTRIPCRPMCNQDKFNMFDTSTAYHNQDDLTNIFTCHGPVSRLLVNIQTIVSSKQSSRLFFTMNYSLHTDYLIRCKTIDQFVISHSKLSKNNKSNFSQIHNSVDIQQSGHILRHDSKSIESHINDQI